MLHAAVILFGVAGLFGKWISAGALIIVWGRVLFATATLLLVLLLRGQSPRLKSAGQWPRLLACGLLLAIHWWSFFHAIRISTVAIGLLAYATAPVMVVLLEPWWFKERLSRSGVLAAAGAVLGIALMVPRLDLSDNIVQGIGWGVISGATFALLSLINRQLVQTEGGVRLALVQDAVAAILLTPIAIALWQPLDLRDLALLALLGVFCTALAHTLFIQSMRKLPARVAAVVSNLEPVYGIVLAFLLLREIPSSRVLIGGALIIAGALWVTLQSRKSAS